MGRVNSQLVNGSIERWEHRAGGACLGLARLGKSSWRKNLLVGASGFQCAELKERALHGEGSMSAMAERGEICSGNGGWSVSS